MLGRFCGSSKRVASRDRRVVSVVWGGTLRVGAGCAESVVVDSGFPSSIVSSDGCRGRKKGLMAVFGFPGVYDLVSYPVGVVKSVGLVFFVELPYLLGVRFVGKGVDG